MLSETGDRQQEGGARRLWGCYMPQSLPKEKLAFPKDQRTQPMLTGRGPPWAGAFDGVSSPEETSRGRTGEDFLLEHRVGYWVLTGLNTQVRG